MKIGIVGLGYVGLVTAAVLADHGNEIVGIDIDMKKIEKLEQGTPPIYEPHLSNYISRNRQNMSFSSDYGNLIGCTAVFVCTPTPTVNGRIDASYVEESCRNIRNVDSNCTVIIKSTVVPGTARRIKNSTGLKVLSNPEFTREGSAVSDTENPDRVVIGGEDAGIAERIWSFTGAPVIMTTNENAELIKYASNAFLATKISFINEIANLCEKIPGADVETVAKGMGYDRRIAPFFLKAGIGYGGSCFPKDTTALLSFARSLGVDLRIVRSTIEVNEERVRHAVNMIDNDLRMRGARKICFLGLSFKDRTDDLRESRAIDAVRALIDLGYSVSAYDPVVRNSIPGVVSCGSIDECLTGVDAVVVAAEWEQFRSIEDRDLKIPVFDLRRLLDAGKFTIYRGIGLWTE